MPLTESDLIARVKTTQDSDALTALVQQQTGIYFSVVNRYAAAYPHVISKADLDGDKLYNIYTFVLAYDPARGTKLSTFVHDRTDYICRKMLSKSKSNPLMGGGVASGIMHFDQSEDTYETSAGTNVTLRDESDEAKVVEVANDELALEDIIAAAWSVCPDKRFVEILQMRHLSGNTIVSWRDIGAKVGLSHEWVRKLYNENMAIVKEHLKERAA